MAATRNRRHPQELASSAAETAFSSVNDTVISQDITDYVVVTKSVLDDDAALDEALEELEVVYVGSDEDEGQAIGQAVGQAGHHHKVTWLRMGYIMTSELVGMGVLSIPVAFQKLGWFLGVFTVLDLQCLRIPLLQSSIRPPLRRCQFLYITCLLYLALIVTNIPKCVTQRRF
jgi:hypothetical protein